MSMSIMEGTRWTGISQVLTQLIRFCVTIFLARLLTPDDFGLLAICFIFITFIDTFKDIGTSSALIQGNIDAYNIGNSLFFFNILIGLSLWFLLWCATPIVSNFFQTERLSAILPVMSLTIIIHSFTIVKKAILEREMQFHILTISELAGILTYSIIAIILAIIGFEVWSLVAGTLGGAIVTSSILWVSGGWYPKIQFRISDLKKVLKFGANLSASQLFSYFIFKADSIIIGRILGETQLGFYNLSQRITTMPSLLIPQIINRVLFPAFSKNQNNNMYIQEKYIRTCGGIALISFPLFSGLYLVAEPVVLFIFGDKWFPVIMLIKILCPVAMIQSVASTIGVLYMVKGRTDLLLIWQIIAGIISIIGFIIGSNWGINGIAFGYLSAIAILFFPAFYIPFRLIDIEFFRFIKAFSPYIAATIIMCIAVTSLKILLAQYEVALFLSMISSIIFGVITYTTSIIFMQPPALFDLKNLLAVKIIGSSPD